MSNFCYNFNSMISPADEPAEGEAITNWNEGGFDAGISYKKVVQLYATLFGMPRWFHNVIFFRDYH